MAKLSLEFAGFDEILKKLTALEADTKSITEEALRKSQEYVTEKAAKAVQNPNLPAKGRYATGDTAKSLQQEPKITWKKTEASIPVGFNIKKGGLPSIFMMYGTPRYMKNQALYDAFYGDDSVGAVYNIQKEIFYKALEELEK